MNGLQRLRPLAVVGALLAAAAVAAALATPQVRNVPVTRRLPPNPAIPTAPTRGAYQPSPATIPVQKAIVLPGWVTGVINVLCIAVIAAVVGVLVWYLLRNSLAVRRARLLVESSEPMAAREQREKVLAAVDAGLSDLAAGEGDPRRAVIACWVRLEEAAAAVGTPRQAGDSPTDLVLRLLAEHDVSAPALYDLAGVYRIARYATHTVDVAMRDRARSALQQVRAELTVRRPEPVPGGAP
jgi:hypothetical protein